MAIDEPALADPAGPPDPAGSPEAPPERADLRGLALAVGVFVALGLWFGVWTVVLIAAIVVIIFLHEGGHYVTAKLAGMKVTEFFIGFGPRLWSFRRGETEYGVKAIPAGAYVRIIGMSNLEEVDPADEDRTYRSKPYWRRISVAVAGSTVHFILALVLIFTVFAGFGARDPGSREWSVVVQPDSPAAAAGLKDGDHIVSVDGLAAGTFQHASDYLRAHPGKTVTLVVERNGVDQELTATLADTHPGSDARVGYLGVSAEIPRLSVGQSVGHSFSTTRTFMWQSVTGLGKLFSPHGLSQYYDNVRGDTPASTGSGATVDQNRPTSVVGIVHVGAQVAQDGVVNVFYLLFAMNVFIGVFNLAPLLPFDGGHVVIATYEKIRSLIGRQTYHADVTKLMPLTYAVIAVLGVVFLSSLYLDIVRPVSIR